MQDQFKIKPLLFSFLLLLILPNVIFYLGQFYFSYSRPLFNADYIIPCLLFISSKKILKALGVLTFILIFFIDCLLIVFQYFPSLNFKDSFYLLGYISAGPKSFIILACMVSCLLLVELIISLWLATKIALKEFVIGVAMLFIFSIFGYFIDLSADSEARFYDTNFVRSSMVYFIEHQKSNFDTLLGGDKLQPLTYNNATMPWFKALKNKNKLNDKLLLIVVESWGSPLNKEIQQDILKNVLAQKNAFDFFDQGSFNFYGFTVEGELRELCQLHSSTLDMYQIKTGFQNCLPNRLSELGYETMSIHGSNSSMYGMKDWYPRAGFNKRLFQESLNSLANCVPFDGICDWDILPFIKQNFKDSKKLFQYWLTLTTHHPYFEHDIHNKRFNCATYDIPRNGDACRSLMLYAQFFDDLADFLVSPEMKGVEVIVVGDHPPPLFKAEEIALYKNKNDKNASVHWLHFKVKE